MMHIAPQVGNNHIFKANLGLNRAIVTQISEQKNEPGWMTDFRLRALEIFEQKPMPSWGADLSALDPYDICYYLKPVDTQHSSWDDVPQDIKDTFDKLGIAKAEQKFLAGVGAQFESEVVYQKLKEKWSALGVLFLDTGTALRDYPELFKKYFAPTYRARSIRG